jgi:hypothetical protein
MLTINRIENAVVERLKAALPLIHVQAYPADIKNFIDTFRHVNGALLVQYTGRKRKFISRHYGTQVVTIEIAAISKNLQQHGGVHPLLDGAFEAVSGEELKEQWADIGLGVVLLAVEEGYELFLEKNGIWVYTQTYESEPFAWVKSEVQPEQTITQFTLTHNGDIETIIPSLD